MERAEIWRRLKNGGVTALIAGPVQRSQITKIVIPLVVVFGLVTGGIAFPVRFGLAIAVGAIAGVAAGFYIRGRRRAAVAKGVEPTGLATLPDGTALR